MKRTKILMLVAILTTAITFAQREAPRSSRADFHKSLSVEQLATLKTKKMTLALDLTEKQQQEIFEFHRVNIEFRKEKMAERKQMREDGQLSKPTAEERFALENAHLDRMIAQQAKLKRILNDEQFDSWKKMQHHKLNHHKRQKGKQSRRG